MTKKKIRAIVRSKLRRPVRIGRNPNRPREWIVEVVGRFPRPRFGIGLTLDAAFQHLGLAYFLKTHGS